MPEPAIIVVFVLASLALLVTPGPSVLYIVARSLDQGRSAGLVSTLGVGLGNLAHVGAATFGLSALLVSSALAFSVVKYAGATYLIYLGIRALLSPPPDSQAVRAARVDLGRTFRQGFAVNLLNPKTALFFFAFLPQFVDPARGQAAGQLLVFGSLFILLALCNDSLYAILAGSARDWLRRNAQVLPFQRIFTGGVFLSLGVATALTGSEKR